MRFPARFLFLATAATAVLVSTSCVALPGLPPLATPASPVTETPTAPPVAEATTTPAPTPVELSAEEKKQQCSEAFFLATGSDKMAGGFPPEYDTFPVEQFTGEVEFDCQFSAPVDSQATNPLLYIQIATGLLADPTTEELQTLIQQLEDSSEWKRAEHLFLGMGEEAGTIVSYVRVDPEDIPEEPSEWAFGEQVMFRAMTPEYHPSFDFDKFEEDTGITLGGTSIEVSYTHGGVYMGPLTP